MLRDVVLRAHGGISDGLIWSIGVVGPFLLTVFGVSDPTARKWGWGLTLILFVLVFLRVFFHEGREHLKRRQIWGCLCSLHEIVFKNDPEFRFTFFVQDPVARVRLPGPHGKSVAEPILVPLVRRKSGQKWSMDVDSSIYFPVTSNAVTSAAWNEGTRLQGGLNHSHLTTILTRQFPKFADREQMEHFYKSELHIDENVVNRIGNSMTRARAILSLPIVDHQGSPLGLVSIDVLGRELVFLNGDEPHDFTHGEELERRTFEVDAVALVSHVEMMRSILINTRL